MRHWNIVFQCLIFFQLLAKHNKPTSNKPLISK